MEFYKVVAILGLSAGCLLGSRPLMRHDFHVSLTQMHYNPADRSFEISIRVFTDDLEKALARSSGHPVHLAPNSKHDSVLEKYVGSHVAYANPQKQTQSIHYVGYEQEMDAHWVYLEMPHPGPFQGGQLKQSVLMELFDDQVNMVNVQYQDRKKTFVFRKNQLVQDVSL